MKFNRSGGVDLARDFLQLPVDNPGVPFLREFGTLLWPRNPQSVRLWRLELSARYARQESRV